MQLSLVLLFCTVHVALCYDDKFDKIQIENIVENDVLHKTVNVCILGVLDCGPFWREVRALAPEIAKTRCAKCTPRQKVIVHTYIEATKQKYPDTWRQIHDMFKKGDTVDFVNRIIPDENMALSIMSTKCGSCTPEQKEIFEKNIKQFAEKYPNDIAELTQKLSPKPE